MVKKAGIIFIPVLAILGVITWMLVTISKNQELDSLKLTHLNQELDSIKSIQNVPFDYKDLIAQLEPKLVSIQAFKSVEDSSLTRKYEFDSFFESEKEDQPEHQVIKKWGSGVLINTINGVQVLTALHVVNRMTKVEIKLEDKLYDADLVWFSELQDLALLKVYELPATKVGFKIAESVVESAERVVVLGKPISTETYISEAVVSVIEGRLLLDKKMLPGMSGGVVCQLNGQPVGIITKSAIKKAAEDFSTAAMFYQIPDSLLNN